MNTTELTLIIVGAAIGYAACSLIAAIFSVKEREPFNTTFEDLDYETHALSQKHVRPWSSAPAQY